LRVQAFSAERVTTIGCTSHRTHLLGESDPARVEGDHDVD
jgi:hypothetical protein